MQEGPVGKGQADGGRESGPKGASERDRRLGDTELAEVGYWKRRCLLTLWLPGITLHANKHMDAFRL